MINHEIIKAEGISKTYLLYSSPSDRLKQFLWRGKKNFFREHAALKDVSFSVKAGETIGIVGRNGSGKSTLLQVMAGILTPTSGKFTREGKVSALLELGAGFNPEFTGRENIFLNAAVLGITREEIAERYDEIVAFSGIGDFIEQPVKTYSSGMYVRLAFSVAAATDPDILIVDEALAVGDEAFQRKCYSRMEDFKSKGGTLIFVSHSAQAVMEVCDRAILMDAGELLLDDSSRKVVEEYQKLIYAPMEKQQELRHTIKVGKTASVEEGKKVEQAGFMDGGMKPETTVSYESKGALITNPRVIDGYGNPLNVLKQGEEYIYRYEVKFGRECRNVKFGMMIKNTTGIPLGGAAGAGAVKEVEKVAAGTAMEISFRFKCSLVAGTYFFSSGVMGVSDEEHGYLHRIIDALMVRVIPSVNSIATGMVDFEVSQEIGKKN